MKCVAISMKNSSLFQPWEITNHNKLLILYIPVPNFALIDIGAWFLAVAESVGPNNVRHF